MSAAPSALLAKKLAGFAPGDLKHVFFTTCGSTAVDSAIRFVHFYNNVLGRPRKKKVISREKSYHGSTYLSASMSGKSRNKEWLDTANEWVHLLPDVNPSRRPEGMSVEDFLEEKITDLETAIQRLGAENVGAFIAEPVLASGGVIIPPKGYHKRCLEVCRQHDVLYISDEVVTAFGRLGHWFASKEAIERLTRYMSRAPLSVDRIHYHAEEQTVTVDAKNLRQVQGTGRSPSSSPCWPRISPAATKA